MTFNVAALQLETKRDFTTNLETAKSLIQKLDCDLLVIPEVFFTDFAYDRFNYSAEFSTDVLKEIVKLSKNRTICFTLNVKSDGKFYNRGYIVHDQKIIHTQDKYKLFTLSDEIKQYSPGSKEQIKVVKTKDFTIAMLICFELRFKELWKAVEGADIVVIPAKWGALRKKHLEVLAQALAIMNQTFVVVADSSDCDMAKSSAIISPFGQFFKDDRQKVIFKKCDLGEVKKMRRYLKVYE